MADSTINIADATSVSRPVDTFTQAGGDHRQAIVVGDATNAYTQMVRAAGDAAVGYATVSTTGSITAVDAVSATGQYSWAGTGAQYLTTGTPTAGSSVTLALDGQSSFQVQLAAFVGSIAIERSIDGGTTWVMVVPHVVGVTKMLTPMGAPYITGRALAQGDCAGSTHVRVRAVAYTSGTPAVRIVASSAPGLLPVTISGSVVPAVATAATRTSVAATTGSTSVVAGPTTTSLQLRYAVYNDSSASLYLAEGSVAASTTSFTVKIAPGGFYESAFNGQVNGIWDAATGSARVTVYNA